MIIEKTQDVKLNAKQRAFCNSKARYPAFVGSWGCGKTMCGILKGLQLSETYAGNLGLIVRKNFTDLHDSTVKDFETYTGLTVNQQHKEVKLPNGSVIMFRHGDELSTLQNVNLGWFMIEQAEEFETDEQFQMLRGRLRREGPKTLRGMVIANTNGHNWVWAMWKRSDPNRDREFNLSEANIDDNDHLRSDTLDDWRKLAVDKPRIYRQFVLNSWDDYGTDALFFAEQMSQARRGGRISNAVPVDEVELVFRVWDIGSVHIAVWFGQLVGNSIRLIDYHQQDNPALGLPEAIEAVKSRGYNVQQDFCGPDIAKGAVNGKTIMNTFIVDEALKLGIDLQPVDSHSFIDGIEAVRAIFPLLQIHETRCADGILALDNYKRQPKPAISTPERKEYADKEVHDWASHGGSAMRYLAVAYQDDLIGNVTGEIKETRKQPEHEMAIADAVAVDDDNPDDILYEQDLT